LRMNRAQVEKSGLGGAEQVHIKQGEATAVLSLVIDEHVPAGCAWLPVGVKAVENLSGFYGSIEVEKVS
jgi:NADH-quinone oxidoreductase subunit G